MTLASSPTRMSAVMIASRTRATCSTPSAAASAGTASARPPSARAALHRTSISGLPNAAICGARRACGARSSPARRPVDAGAVTSRLTNGMGTHQFDDRLGDLFDRPDVLGSSISYEFAGHAPDNGGGLLLPRWSARPARAAASSHLLRRAPSRSSALRSIAWRRNAQARWLPFVPRSDATDSRAATARTWRSCPSIAAPRSGRRRRARYRSCLPAKASDGSLRPPEARIDDRAVWQKDR